MALPANKKGVSNGVNLVNGQLSSEEPLPPLIDFCEYSVELSRPFRGLRAWVGLKLFGIDAFRANLQRLRSSALGLASQLDSDAVDTGCPGVRIVHWPELAIFTFKWEDLKKDQEEKNLQAQNQRTKELMASINCVENSVLLTSATVEKQFLIRVALSCFRTTEKDVEALLKNIKGARQKMM
jgi:aromatic-L-amino-acid decarboxylase